VNQGTVTWLDGTLYLQNSGGTVTNAAGALWDVQGNLTITSTVCGAPSFTNAGTLRKSAGTGALTVGRCVTMVHTGVLEVQSGSLVVASSLTASGAVILAAGTTFPLTNVTLNAGTTFSGAGAVQLGTTVVNGDITFTVATTQTGSVSGNGKVIVGNTFTWTTGTTSAAGGVEVPAGQTLTLATASDKILNNVPLVNQGTVTWLDGTLYIQNTAIVTNAAGALWDAQGDRVFSSTICGAPSFINAGTVRMSGVAATLTIGSCVAFTNTGTVQLRLGGTGGGQFDRIAAGAVSLAGTLDVTLTNGFVPVSGNTFDVMTYGTRTGTFTTISGNGHTYAPTYGANILTLTKQ
jgi:hypothetical protein